MSFDQHDPGFIRDPARVFGPIREEHPVLHSDRYGGFWLLTRYEDVTAAALDCEGLTSAVPGTTLIPSTQPRTEPLLPLELDPPEHTRYRALVNPLFAKPRIDTMRPALEALATRLLEPFARDGGGDVMAAFAHPMSLGSLALLMDLPEEDEERWFDWVERMYSNAILDSDDHAAAAHEAEAYIDELIEARKREPRDDFIGQLLRAEVDGHRLSHTDVRQFGMVMLLAGYETTSGAMGMSLMHLAEHPELRARLFADPDGLAHLAVNELLRFVSPVQVFGRNAAHDLELHGQTIPAGDIVLLGYGAANHDPRAFEHPDEVVLDRHPNRHVAFGHGRHLCLGANLARLELTIMIEQFAARFPDFRVDPDRPPTWKPRGDVRALRSLHLVSG
ncbi:MAG TPA: cytochrome P450 [Candidatus Limnocylindrales bacterium]|nr:cytochrome P450 [Candidatus Limnocylindrales bacterium]